MKKNTFNWIFFLNIFIMFLPACTNRLSDIKVVATSANIEIGDSTALAGGIIPYYVKGMVAPIRTQSVIITDGKTKICMTSCDIIRIRRDFGDDVAREIEAMYNIPFENILIGATHSHSGPVLSDWSDKNADQTSNLAVRKAILESVALAEAKLKDAGPDDLFFAEGYATIGQNSRVIMDDGSILWVPTRNEYGYNKPTGPYDPQLPIFVFKNRDGKIETTLFNHSTHNIGSGGTGVSPCFYGLAVQQIEKELGGTVLFFPGACGSTHVFSDPVSERVFRIKDGINRTYLKAEKKEINRLVSIKKEFDFRIRSFNEDVHQKAVEAYCNRYVSDPAQIINSFKNRRDKLASQSGQIRKSWLQVIMLGDIVFVSVPGELFAELGMEIKRRSPFRYTYIIGYSNDAIGYLPDREAFSLGGYQTWVGPCISEEGTGENVVNEAISILNYLYRD